MKHTAEEYKILAKRFNEKSFFAKLYLIKTNPELFYIESDGYNIRLRLEEEAMVLGLDTLFEFPEFLEFSYLRDIFSYSDINIKPLR